MLMQIIYFMNWKCCNY